MDLLSKSFDSFFTSESKVAVLKGGWGVGKTYFWESYINEQIGKKNLSQIAYSYISLFGKTSLSDVKKSIFHEARPIASDLIIEKMFDQEFAKSSRLLKKAPWLRNAIYKAQTKSPLLGWFSDKAQHIPLIAKFSNTISTLEYSLVNNYVICFDDLERKGGTLSVREIMGLIDELALRKNCKVILVFNEDSLENENDKKEFESYREKVVDIELSHNPSSTDNFHLVYQSDYPQADTIIEVVKELDIRNIRVLKKIKWHLDNAEPYFKDVNEEIFQEYVVHASLLSWGFYVRDETLPYKYLWEQLTESSWMTFLSDDDDSEKSPSELRYRSIASNLNLAPSDFDKYISFYLQHGYMDENGISDVIVAMIESIENNKANARLRAAWDIYSGSFDDNLNDFIDAMKSVLDNDMERLALTSFASTIDILEEFNVEVSKYIENYITIHQEKLKKIDRDSWDMGRVKSKDLREAIETLHEESKKFNLDDVAERIAVNSGWNDGDIDFLLSLTQKDYYDWMKSNPDNLTKKVRKGLLIFRNLRSSNENEETQYSKINGNVVGALKDVASENEFNRKRVNYIYGIES